MVLKSNSNLIEIRQDVHLAERIIGDLFPDQSQRSLVLKILADAIFCAARSSPASWGISLFEQRLCMNVGRGAVLQLYPNEILFIVTGRLFDMLSREERTPFRFNRQYSFVSDAVEGWLSARSLSKYGPFIRAHTDLIERAAQDRKNCFWPHSHSPSVVELLRQHGFAVPEPDYNIAASTSGDVASKTMPDLDEMEQVTMEGRRVLRQHLVTERNQELARRKNEESNGSCRTARM
jgi:hypothetical protein